MRAGAIAIEALDQDGGGPEDQRLRKTKLQYSQKDEQKVHRHRAGNSRQANLEPSRQNGDQEIADELRDIPAGGIDSAIKEHTRACQNDKADKHLGAKAQFSPRLRAANHVPPFNNQLGFLPLDLYI